jgi:hypothetical protein
MNRGGGDESINGWQRSSAVFGIAGDHALNPGDFRVDGQDAAFKTATEFFLDPCGQMRDSGPHPVRNEKAETSRRVEIQGPEAVTAGLSASTPAPGKNRGGTRYCVERTKCAITGV